jgi:hypothetical protein
MAALRQILNYTPAVVLWLLVVAWVVSWFGDSSFATNIRSYDVIVMSWAGTLLLGFGRYLAVPTYFFDYHCFAWDQLLGLVYVDRFEVGCLVQLPYPLILSAMLLLVIGPFFYFRFRPYYLRWHL